MDFQQELLNINKGLASKGISMRIEKRGQKLYFRGPLPSKKEPHVKKVQRISLNLTSDLEGLKQAEKILELILLQLKINKFNWENWSRKNNNLPSKKNNYSVDHSIKRFKDKFFADQGKSKSLSSQISTWQSAYRPYLKRIEEIAKEKKQELGKGLFREVLLTYRENSRSRQQCAVTIGALGRYLELELPEDWKKLGSGYGINQSQFRVLPTDNEIKEIFKSIPNQSWQIVFGLMATYGLRNHEVFFCDLSTLRTNGDRVIRVLPTTKTGEHQVWPFHPEWVDLFKLNRIGESKNLLPKINTDLTKTTLQKVGRRVTEQFRRYNLPIRPYDLRHAWAVRTIHIGLPNTVSARMMGHSVAIHTKTYHHWITRRDQQQAVDKALSKQQEPNYNI